MGSIAGIKRISALKVLGISIAVTILSILLFLFRRTLLDAFSIVIGGGTIAFLIEPLARLYERKFSRGLSALCALLSCLGTLLIIIWLLLPSMIAELLLLVESLPQSIRMVKGWLHTAVDWLEGYFPGIQLPQPSLQGDQIPMLAKSTIDFAGDIAAFFYQFSLMVVLSYFFLCDRSRLLMRMELLIPRKVRTTAARMGNAVCRELKLYLRGQGIIAVIVGTLAAIGLALVGVRSAFVLGSIVGMLNMIPYFGPVIGAVPAILMALNSGWKTAVWAAAILWMVQQIDSMLISPRIMSGVSGISPAAVLLAIFIGSGLGGIVGMLLAVPAVMAYRTVFRVFVQRYENV